MTKLKPWYNILVIVGLLGVILGPWLFTRPYLCGWSCFDFSQTGQIGDTIGGVTAPIVGIVSIILLWLTFREQLKFNEKQDTINNEQKKFNDASRVISMQAQLMQIDDSIRYGFSSMGRIHEGRGSSSLRNLRKGTPADVKIPYEVLITLIDRVHMLDVSVSSLVNVAIQSALTEAEKRSIMSIARVYLEDILNFYEMVDLHNIDYLLPLCEAGNELIGISSAREAISTKIKSYAEKLREVSDVCKIIIR